MLPELLAQIPPHEPISSVSTDGAYETKGCHTAIAQRGAQAVIPPRKKAMRGKDLDGSVRAQCSAARLPKAVVGYLEEVERLPPKKPGGDQHTLLQTPGRAGDRQHVRAPGDGFACVCGFVQPLYATWTPDNGACGGHGIAASGVGVISV